MSSLQKCRGMQGYHCQASVFQVTINEVKQRIPRLYEQGADYLRIGLYVMCWFQWVLSGSSVERIAETRKAGAMIPLPLGIVNMLLFLSASGGDSCEAY